MIEHTRYARMQLESGGFKIDPVTGVASRGNWTIYPTQHMGVSVHNRLWTSDVEQFDGIDQLLEMIAWSEKSHPRV